ncbi:MAG: hypothetical protein WDO17_16255 [Alphaproteobacteria bacterium]
MPDDLDIALDFAPVQQAAEHVRDMLLGLRRRHDLARFEYTKEVRIAPTEIPHSHPKLTLNTWVGDDLSLLSTYLHEQMHWYLTWYSHARAEQWQELFRLLRERYPEVPDSAEGGAQDEFSTYLHLIVNWLEIESASQFAERERVVALAAGRPFYRWPYRTVIADWEPLGALYAAQGLVPFRLATDMSADELRLAGQPDEAPVG